MCFWERFWRSESKKATISCFAALIPATIALAFPLFFGKFIMVILGAKAWSFWRDWSVEPSFTAMISWIWGDSRRVLMTPETFFSSLKTGTIAEVFMVLLYGIFMRQVEKYYCEILRCFCLVGLLDLLLLKW